MEVPLKHPLIDASTACSTIKHPDLILTLIDMATARGKGKMNLSKNDATPIYGYH